MTAPGLTATPLPADRDALEAEAEFLARSLRDLEAEHLAGDLDDADYAALRDSYTARTAAVLRALQGKDGTAAVVTSAAPARPAARRRVGPSRWAVGFVVVAFAVGAGLLVARVAGTRTTGAGLTGDVRASTAGELQRCLELASVALRGEAAGGGQGQGVGAASNSLLGAVQCYSGVLENQPSNAQALAYRGWLLVRTGSDELVTAGVKDLDAAVRSDPTYPDARAFRAIVFFRVGEPAAAQAELDALDQLEAPPIIDQILGQFGVREGVAEALRNASGPSGDGTTTTTS